MTMIVNPAAPPSTSAASGAAPLFGSDGASFKDVLDAVNPLQQLPLVSNLYRAASGDSISLVSRVAGGALFGGPLGAGLALVSGLFEAVTGSGPVETLASAFTARQPMQVADEPVARKPFAEPPAGGLAATAPVTGAAVAAVEDVRERAYRNAVSGVVLDQKLKTDTFKT